MAYNIKIVGDILNTTVVSRYTEEDKNLLSSKELKENFGGKDDYIEYYIYDIKGNLLNTDYNYIDYKLPSNAPLKPGTSTPPNTTGNIQTENVGVVSTLSPSTSSLYPIIEIDPVKDLQNIGYSSGEFKVKYYFFNNRISNVFDSDLFIKEISPDRTELRLASITLTNEEIETYAISLINEINNTTDYYVDYLLNFGNDKQIVAVNVALNKVPEGYEILFKLYQPLPVDIKDKTQLWVVEEKVSPYEFEINLDKLLVPPPPPTLRGPNFDINLNNIGTIGTPYTNYQTLISRLETLQNSSYQQILGLLTSQSADINIDYTDYNNFSFFGSVEQRLYNFYNKAKQIEDYNNLISTYTPLSASSPNLITEINQYSSSINNIISQFDGYESYLYFESSSYAYPKSGSLKPYKLLSTSSVAVNNWYSTFSLSASLYDKNNVNNLIYALPAYLIDDGKNQPFLTFLNMVGQYFDNVWIYLKSITDLNVANNNLEVGISKDLVYYQLQSLGLKLYNSQAGEDVNQYLIGSNTGSSVWDNNTTITGSYLNNIPRKDLVSELYKRIYHNLPLLLKQKGTVAGLESLMTVFGIPSKPYNSSNGSLCALYKVVCLDTSQDTEIDYTACGDSSTGVTYIFPYNPAGGTFTNYLWIDTAYPYQAVPSANVTFTLVDTGNTTILNVKEFGGGNKAELINGYNNDKVRIIDNSIVTNYYYSGSVLLPFHSLQTFPTASAEFRENDMHYVDISFSPQTQIDTYASGAIASNNATWSLDDYIGDPRAQYSGSYPDLDTQRKLYYQTGVPGYAPFTASLLNYNGFIRLIQYFDNSLFKMLADFVPERASLSTGVTINSPVLERNKVSYANPTTSTTQSVPTAEYSSSTISAQYGNFYNALSSSNDSIAWYNGELSGSLIDIGEQFDEANYNPYLYPNNPSTTFNTTCQTYRIQNTDPGDSSQTVYFVPCYQTQYSSSQINGNGTYIDVCINTIYPILKENSGTVSSSSLGDCGAYLSINQNQFHHSDFDILMNNVSSSITSQFRNDIEYIYGTTGSITYPAQLQDSYLTLRSYNISRYEGSKVTSLLYNTYTSASYTGSDGLTLQDGDLSYGKTAAIDHNTRRIGLFTQIQSSSYLPGRNTVALKYFVDEFGNLTELNQLNKNWMDLQRTFTLGELASVSLFDNKKFSNQKTTDGKKLIFDSGYTYTPVLYLGDCAVTPQLAFTNLGNPGSFLSKAKNSGNPDAYIAGSTTNHYALSGGYVTSLFDNVTDGADFFKSGSSTSTSASYTVQEVGSHNVSISLPFNIQTEIVSPAVSSSWEFTVVRKRGGSPTTLSSQIYTFVSGDPVSTYLTYTYELVSGGASRFTYSLTYPLFSQAIYVKGYVTGFGVDCTTNSNQKDYHLSSPAIFNPGQSSVSISGTTPLTCGINGSFNYKRGNYRGTSLTGYYLQISIDGGSTYTIVGGTSTSVTLASGCIIYINFDNSCQDLGCA
jgi:hypothetical protein